MSRDRGHIAITGASSGIGRSIAHAFGTEGNRLSLVARREPLLDELAGELSVPALGIPWDLADVPAAVGWVAQAEAAHGPIDVLVLNAGVQYVEPALGVDDDRAEALLAVNLRAPIRIASAVVPAMRARGAGTVVVIASLAAIVHSPWMAHYNASKAGLAAYFETLRVELAGTGVGVVTVYPGPVTTAMERAARERIAPADSRGVAERLPTGSPEELARLVRQAVSRERPRVVYPKAYGLTRHLRVASQWFTNRFTPRLDE